MCISHWYTVKKAIPGHMDDAGGGANISMQDDSGRESRQQVRVSAPSESSQPQRRTVSRGRSPGRRTPVSDVGPKRAAGMEPLRASTPLGAAVSTTPGSANSAHARNPSPFDRRSSGSLIFGSNKDDNPINRLLKISLQDLQNGRKQWYSLDEAARGLLHALVRFSTEHYSKVQKCEKTVSGQADMIAAWDEKVKQLQWTVWNKGMEVVQLEKDLEATGKEKEELVNRVADLENEVSKLKRHRPGVDDEALREKIQRMVSEAIDDASIGDLRGGGGAGQRAPASPGSPKPQKLASVVAPFLIDATDAVISPSNEQPVEAPRLSQVNSALAKVWECLQAKADAHATVEALRQKASKAELRSSLSSKADVKDGDKVKAEAVDLRLTEMEKQLARKAEKDFAMEELHDLQQQLHKKVDTDIVNRVIDSRVKKLSDRISDLLSMLKEDRMREESASPAALAQASQESIGMMETPREGRESPDPAVIESARNFLLALDGQNQSLNPPGSAKSNKSSPKRPASQRAATAPGSVPSESRRAVPTLPLPFLDERAMSTQSVSRSPSTGHVGTHTMHANFEPRSREQSPRGRHAPAPPSRSPSRPVSPRSRPISPRAAPPMHSDEEVAKLSQDVRDLQDKIDGCAMLRVDADTFTAMLTTMRAEMEHLKNLMATLKEATGQFLDNGAAVTSSDLELVQTMVSDLRTEVGRVQNRVKEHEQTLSVNRLSSPSRGRSPGRGVSPSPSHGGVRGSSPVPGHESPSASRIKAQLVDIEANCSQLNADYFGLQSSVSLLKVEVSDVRSALNRRIDGKFSELTTQLQRKANLDEVAHYVDQVLHGGSGIGRNDSTFGTNSSFGQ